jgi:diketogulonate reductase-like aldo/keto reductase
VIDSYVLHGPTRRDGLADADWQAWRAIEAIHRSGKARLLGVSNVSLGQLRLLFEGANTQPRFVQNRCYAALGWDKAIREYCTANGIVYQGFSLLTANRAVLAHRDLGRIANRYGVTPAQVIFRFALDIGMVPITGTTSADHMRADLAVFDFHLEPAELALIEALGIQ